MIAKRILPVLGALIVWAHGLWGQYSPPNSPQFHFQSYGNAAALDYVFMGAYRILPPFYLRATNMLLDRTGDLVWYQQAQMWALDFSLHANGRMAYSDNVYWHVLDSNFAEVDSVACRGYITDPHDMVMTADGHYFLICIEDTIVDLSALLTASGTAGSSAGRVDGVVIQELDGGKKVVQEWHGLRHYALTDPDSAYFTNPSVFELNHTNSIDLDGHGKLLLSHRALNEICQIDWATGNIDWRLGGKNNDFQYQGAVATVGQHDARYLPNGHISTFDNGNLQHLARGIEIALETTQLTATLIWEFAQGHSDAMGSMRRMADGSALIGFGRATPSNLPVVSYVAADSSKIFDISFLDSSSTYRAIPATLPFALNRPQLVCQELSGQVQLGVDGLHLQYEWTTGEHTATIVVADTGWYQAFVPRGIGMISTSPLHITDLANACLVLSEAPATQNHRAPTWLGMYDLLGRRVTQPQMGQIYIDRYSDGSRRKRAYF